MGISLSICVLTLCYVLAKTRYGNSHLILVSVKEHWMWKLYKMSKKELIFFHFFDGCMIFSLIKHCILFLVFFITDGTYNTSPDFCMLISQSHPFMIYMIYIYIYIYMIDISIYISLLMNKHACIAFLLSHLLIGHH